jgi:hypothetical protein
MVLYRRSSFRQKINRRNLWTPRHVSHRVSPSTIAIKAIARQTLGPSFSILASSFGAQAAHLPSFRAFYKK